MSTRRTDYRYFDVVMAAFVIVLCVSSTAGGPKVTQVWGLTVGAGIFFYPFIYIFNDVLTEVYGYAHSRRAVWMGFAGLFFASVMTLVITWLPPAPDWKDQAAYITVFGQTPRIVLASLVAFAAGEFVNAYVLAKMKIFQEGQHLWMRTIGSSVVGVAVDALVFYPCAFYGTWPMALLLTVMGTEYLLKVGGEVVFTPITYQVIGFLKRAEHEDYYDRDTDFNPFALEV
ncbi:MAG: rane protein [Cyanobacteria bacterium RYN_339]|nr:rane protein [Cyanobacteria bacterium RYN_339]